MSRRIVLGFAALMLLSSIAVAQPLADRVPDDAMLYVGWRGSETLGKEYDASRLKAVLADSDFPRLFSDFLPKLAARVGQEEREAGEALQMMSAIGSHMWTHPCALYVGTTPDPNQPPPVLLLCEAGADAPALEQQVQAALQKNPNGPPLQVTTLEGGIVVVSMQEYQPKPERPLSSSPEFKAAMAQVGKDPVATVYVDGARIVALVDKMAGMENAEEWPRVRDALGLGGLKSFVWTGGFDGKDWTSRAFLGAVPAAQRAGLLALVGGKPVDDALFKAIPPNATIAGAGQLDLGKVFDGIRDGVGKVEPQSLQEFDDGVGFVNQILGLDVRNDVLEPLGDGWAYYADPTVGGNGILGFALVNKLDDPAKADQSLAKLANSINTLLRQQLKKENITIQFAETKVGDQTIHYLATPALSPAWTVRNGNLYVALYPQIVASAMRATDGGKTILDNPAFVAMRARLGQQKNASSIQFLDLPKTAGDGYQMWLFVSRLYLGVGDIFGVQSPAMVLPPLDRMLPHLAPAGAVSWTDDAGWHMTSVSPFPGSSTLASGGSVAAASVAQTAVAVSILLPSLNRARETANRVKCSSNLRQIALASIMYANDNKGNFPPDFGALVKNQYLTVEAFLCPATGAVMPPNAAAMKPDELADWVNENASYTWLGNGKNVNTPADTPIACEKEHNHAMQGMNIVFADGHVEWHTMPAAQELIEKQANPNPQNNGGL